MISALGFMFSANCEDVLLIKKDSPEWQKDMLNGIGGKAEDYDQTPFHTMIREFEEECGLVTGTRQWNHFCTLNIGVDSKVYCFSCISETDHLYNFEKREDEEPGIFQVKNLPPNIIKNLSWLIPMAIDGEFTNAEVFYL